MKKHNFLLATSLQLYIVKITRDFKEENHKF